MEFCVEISQEWLPYLYIAAYLLVTWTFGLFAARKIYKCFRETDSEAGPFALFLWIFMPILWPFSLAYWVITK
jgi:hypothetical protein